MPKHGKKYRDAVKNIDLSAAYNVDEAMRLALKASFATFDETVDVAMCLGSIPNTPIRWCAAP
jgi:large subunit ribosomal protein L1